MGSRDHRIMGSQVLGGRGTGPPSRLHILHSPHLQSENDLPEGHSFRGRWREGRERWREDTVSASPQAQREPGNT